MMKKQNLLVSIDGGATKTIVRIYNFDGKILGEHKGGPANIASDTKQSWHSVSTTLDYVIKETGLSVENINLYGGGGFAGAEVPEACERFKKLCKGFEKFNFKTDAYTSCLGAHNGKNGAIIAVGTGAVAYAIANGKSKKLSGWGFPQDDQGGGAWLGLQLISDMLQRVEGRKPKTNLSENLYQYIKQQGEDPMLWAVGAHPTKFGSLVPWLVDEAKKGCDEANAFLNQAANVISELATALLQDEFVDLPLSLLGGMSEIIAPRLAPLIRERIVPAKGHSLEGAYYLALQAYQNKEVN